MIKATQQQLETIAAAALKRDANGVRELLREGVWYRDATLYIDGFLQDASAKQFVLDQALCKCGNVAVKWNRVPKCGGCSFRKALMKIEYGPEKKT